MSNLSFKPGDKAIFKSEFLYPDFNDRPCVIEKTRQKEFLSNYFKYRIRFIDRDQEGFYATEKELVPMV